MTHSPASDSLRVMVVDDHHLSRQFTLAALRQFTLNVKEAASLSEAEGLAARWRPHVILLDLDLPDGHGLQLIGRLRASWPAARVLPRFIAMTGYRDVAPYAGCGERPGIPVLVKPVSATQLKNAVLGEDPAVAAVASPETGLPMLRRLFRDELAADLPVLETAVANRNGQRAASILHRLIASSALCAEPGIEEALRALDAALRVQASAGRLASAWVQVLNRAEELTGL